ncbi:MAG: 7-cyano-7-deazaguanine synthase QueC [Alphaproteobacteria bacterium]|nr:7-cyano-7-deazaguanine synthase QueC [Alphaproteobacteria bacterium]MBV9420426.1 7-cyano-7-deazaguanine synthase QueC [Alphaproteobacteria bacterium]MBV9539954.1 7-cyano-7-deazaguanine synthase QueC [Alphaproteobacteria bacterium]MBV9904741.1 7-cyano-7-deazaguanine synthase QueC [Alphaproteobacteria bacterium]
MNGDIALVLFSGGQDSTTCVAWALSHFARVETVGFDYGQRHAVELTARPLLRAAMAAMPWTGELGDDHVLPINTFKAIGGTALTDDMKMEMGRDGLPTTFVPARNLMFLNVAAALGYRRGISDLVGGMCETDFSGYPDCRDETIKATARALSLGLARETRLHTPLMWLDKAQTWKLAEELGGKPLVDLIVQETVTCYAGDPTPHDWGKGCGRCPACDLRAKGYAKYAAA